MIHFSKALALAADPDTLDCGVIGHHSLVTADSLTATSEAFPRVIENVANDLTSLAWEASSADEQTIDVALSDEDGIDYIGIARHNLGSSRTRVKISAQLESGEFTTLFEFIPADDRTIMLLTERIVPFSVRVELFPKDTPPIIAVLKVGRRLTLQRRIYAGHTPAVFGRQDEIVNGSSMNGQFLGRILIGEMLNTGVSLNNLTPRWYREEFDKFVKDARTGAFFYSWRPLSFPDEVAYGWFTSTPRPTNEQPNGFMSVSFEMEAIA